MGRRRNDLLPATMTLLPVIGILVLAFCLEARAMSNNIPVQGRLTDAAGNPLNGTYSIRGAVYTAASGGTPVCADTNDVTVVNGLFTMVLGNCASSDFSGTQQLYLGIQVGSDEEMIPRQPLYGVPFAHGLVNGVLSSGASTYLFVPGSAVVKKNSEDRTRFEIAHGSAQVYSGDAAGGPTYVRIPLAIPSMLYGQPVRVTEVRVYYRCQTYGEGYIGVTALSKYTGADTFVYLFDDHTIRTSTTATYYTIPTDSQYNTLSSAQGILTLGLVLNFSNETSYVQIYGVRLTLDTNL